MAEYSCAPIRMVPLYECVMHDCGRCEHARKHEWNSYCNGRPCIHGGEVCVRAGWTQVERVSPKEIKRLYAEISSRMLKYHELMRRWFLYHYGDIQAFAEKVLGAKVLGMELEPDQETWCAYTINIYVDGHVEDGVNFEIEEYCRKELGLDKAVFISAYVILKEHMEWWE